MGMLQLAPNSSSLFFPLREQLKIFNHRMIEADHSKKFLLSGIKQVAIFSSTGCNIQSDPIVNWFDKDKVSQGDSVENFDNSFHSERHPPCFLV